MPARLIVSFDCEGKWGIADRSRRRIDALSSEKLRKAYSEILSTLRVHNARATFGFVGALCMDRDWLQEKCLRLDQSISINGIDWLREAKAALKIGDLSGWCEPDLIKMVMADSNQHLCSHGGFHLPYDEKKVSVTAIDEDIRVIEELRGIYNLKLDVLIYPRNIIGYQIKLKKSGFKAYRDIDSCENIAGVYGKIIRIVNEFSSFDKIPIMGNHGIDDRDLVTLSSAKFLNAKIGLRKLVPVNVTKTRIDTIIKFAVANGSILHLYTHPHNFIADPTMGDKLNYLLAVASKYVKHGDLEIATMEDELNDDI